MYNRRYPNWKTVRFIIYAIIGFILSSNTISAEWPMYLFSPEHCSYTYSTAPDNNATLWHGPGGGTHSVATDNSTVYVASGYVYALDINNGHIKWSHPFTFEIYTPAICDDKLIVAEEVNHTIYALNITNGNLIWTYLIVGNLTFVCSEPVVSNNVIYISAGGGDNTGYNWGSLIALNSKNGKEIWNFTAQEKGAFRFSPTVANGLVYVTQDSGSTTQPAIYALNQTTGTLVWTSPSNCSLTRTPAAYGKRLYLAGDGMVFCLDALKGNILWQYCFNYYIVSTPAIAYNKVFITGGSFEYKPGKVVALNMINGAESWNFSTVGRSENPATVADGKVFFTSHGSNYAEGWLTVLNSTYGSIVWKYRFNYSVIASPVISNGFVFVEADDTWAFGSVSVIEYQNFSLTVIITINILSVWIIPRYKKYFLSLKREFYK